MFEFLLAFWVTFIVGKYHFYTTKYGLKLVEDRKSLHGQIG